MTFALFLGFIAISIALGALAVTEIVAVFRDGRGWRDGWWVVLVVPLLWIAAEFVLAHLWVRATSRLVARFD